jgi:hypothetical protein
MLVEYIALCRWYINITVKILDIIHRLVFHLKHNVLETRFCLRLHMELTQLAPVDGTSLSVSEDRTMDNILKIVILFKYC